MAGVIAINAGSSSIKLAMFSGDTAVTRREIGDLPADGSGHAAAIERVLADLGAVAVTAVGHRIVHGGARAGPAVVTPAVRAELERLVPLAPLHQPVCLAALDAAARLLPEAAHVACFDTAFHRTIPEVARRYALPREHADIVAYGFHGLSYEYIASQLPAHLGDRADGRVIVAHLGSGASMCAMRGRASVATTMGFTPLDGLVMGTRPGALDPGIALYLIEQRGLSAAAVRDLLYHRSGLLGVSGQSASMKDLLASPSESARAAVELFVYRCATTIGALAAALGGLDALVFTGGIGEHSEVIRARVTEASRWLGGFAALAIATDEEQMIARHATAIRRGA
jgi:acetate kinase